MTPPQNPSQPQYSLNLGILPPASSVSADDSSGEVYMAPNGDFQVTRTAPLGGPFFATVAVNSRSGAFIGVGVDLLKLFREPDSASPAPSHPASTPAPSAPAQVDAAAAAHASLAHFLRRGAALAVTRSVQHALAKALGF